MTVSSKTASKYMENLYQSFVDEDGSDDGNIVRSIEPSVGMLADETGIGSSFRQN